MLGFMKEGQILFDSRAGLGTIITSGINSRLRNRINDEIESSVNEEFSNEKNWTQFPETYINSTEVRDFDIGFAGDVTSLALVVPITNKIVIAGAYNYSAGIDVDLGVTGLSAKLAQERGTEEVAVRFDVLMDVSLVTQMKFRMNTLSLGIGSALINTADRKLAIGATVTRYQVENTRKVFADASGLVVVGGAENRYFNNPQDPNLNTELGESNAFFIDVYGDYEATEHGIKFGAYYRLDKALHLSLIYNQVPNFDLTGSNTRASVFLPVFLVGSGEDILKGDIDVDLDSLQANKPNLTTERDISSIVEDGRLNLPSSFTLGLDFALNKHTLVFNYTRYFGELSFTNGGHTIGKDLTHGLGIGMDFRMRDRFDSWGQLALIPVRILFLDIDGFFIPVFRKIYGV